LLFRRPLLRFSPTLLDDVTSSDPRAQSPRFLSALDRLSKSVLY
jgi:hypothetical protein